MKSSNGKVQHRPSIEATVKMFGKEYKNVDLSGLDKGGLYNKKRDYSAILIILH